MLCARSRGGDFPLGSLYPSFHPSCLPSLSLSLLQPGGEGIPRGSLTRRPEIPALLYQCPAVDFAVSSRFPVFLIEPPYPQGPLQLPREGSQRLSGVSKKAKIFAALSYRGLSPRSPSPARSSDHPGTPSLRKQSQTNRTRWTGLERGEGFSTRVMPAVTWAGAGDRDRAEGRVCQPAVVQTKANLYSESMAAQF